MGQAKRRKQQLGPLYGTTESSISQLAQKIVEQTAIKHIKAAMAKNLPVVLIGTEASRPLAAAAELPWLHELPEKDPVPQWVAWDPVIAEAGGPLLPPPICDDRLVVLGIGMSEWVSRRSAKWAQFLNSDNPSSFLNALMTAARLDINTDA
jgi:hypothetical protein